MAERADIGPLGADDAQRIFVRRQTPGQLQLVDRDRSRLSLHLTAPAGDLVELLPADLDGGVHRRDLRKLSREAGQNRAYLVLADGDRGPLQHRAGRVLRIGGHAELQNRPVFFPAALGEGHRLGRLTDEHREHPCRHRVERAGVTDTLFPENTAQLGAHVHARPALRLVDNDHAIRHKRSVSPSARSIRAVFLVDGFLHRA